MAHPLAVLVMLLTLATLCRTKGSSSNDVESAPDTSNSCLATDISESDAKVEIFFINLDRSHERRAFMENQLKFYGYHTGNRVRAYTLRDVTVPDEVSVVKDCLSVSTPTLNYVTTSRLHNPITESISLKEGNSTRRKVVVTALCGRPKNTRRELIVTISHLQAMRTAIYSNSTNPYALILEDDTSIAFETDFMEMAKTAPKGFGILQLVTSNDHEVRLLLNAYTANSSNLWQLRTEQDYWCAGAYLINKAVMKPYIDGVFSSLANDWTGVSVVAGYGPPCWPRSCCVNAKGEKAVGHKTPLFVPHFPCMNAPRGYQSDHFIFRLAMGRTYMSTVQLFSSAASGNTSTLHQGHVSLHQGAFNRINSGLEDMVKGVLPTPYFVNKKCRYEREIK